MGNSQVLRRSFSRSIEAFQFEVGKLEKSSQFSCHHWVPLLLSKRETGKFLQGLESALLEIASGEKQETAPVWSHCSGMGIASLDLHKELDSPDN